MQLAKQILKTALWAILICLIFQSVSLSALAITIEKVPKPRVNYGGWVTDMANLISPETETQLNKIISEYRRKTDTEIAVVTVQDTAPNSTPNLFATQLFKYWGIGKKGINNGVLFLVSKAERRVEIKTGYGIEAILPNTKVKEIIQLKIIPLYKLGDYSLGTLVGTQALIEALSEHSIPPTPSKVKNASTGTDEYTFRFFGLFGTLIVIIVVISRPLLLAPEGSSRIFASQKDIAPQCAVCKQWMEKLDLQSLESYLSPPEQVAQKLGSVSFDGWRCPKCHSNLTVKGIHVRAYVIKDKKFTTCPTCKELTVERESQVLQSVTKIQEGKRLIIEKCHCCSYFKEWTQIRPPLSPYNSSYYSNDGGSSGSSSWGSGGGDFGGGDCGGGGDGGSW